MTVSKNKAHEDGGYLSEYGDKFSFRILGNPILDFCCHDLQNYFALLSYLSVKSPTSRAESLRYPNCRPWSSVSVSDYAL